jgi:hypothetical protein
MNTDGEPERQVLRWWVFFRWRLVAAAVHFDVF